MPGFSFSKKERLSSRKVISVLFQSGRSLHKPPLKLLYHISENQDIPAMVVITVPKRLYKRAVDRNLLKRRIREVYRLRKPLLYQRLNELDKKVALMILYNHTRIQDFHAIESALNEALDQLLYQLSK